MSTPDTDFAAEAQHAYRLARGTNALLPDHELAPIIQSVESANHTAEKMDSNFVQDIWLTTSVLRRRGDGPSLVLVPLTEVGRFVTLLREPNERLGLHFGIDLFIYGVLETTQETDHDRLTDGDITEIVETLSLSDSAETVHVPDDHNDDAWHDVLSIKPGLVALIGQTHNGEPDGLSPRIESWVRTLPPTTPVLRYWERKRNVIAEVSRVSSDRRPGQIITPTIKFHRPVESAEVAAQLLRPRPPVVSITGKPGTGRTALLSEVAGQLQQSGQPMVLRLFQGGDHGLVDALQNTLDHLATNEARVPEVIVFDDFDRFARLGRDRPDTDLIERLSIMAEIGYFRFLLVLNESRLSTLENVDSDLADYIRHVRLNNLSADSLSTIVKDETKQSATAAGLRLADDIVDAALSPAYESDTIGHPGLAIARVESAIARARQRRRRSLSTAELELSTDADSTSNAQDLTRVLGESVRGQDHAISAVAERLAPSLQGLKLSPERPHGVFLFVGPSGSGKTEMARQLARSVYGTKDELVRLDMSEYADEADARMKLIGASRIWKGSSTEGLLTTKVLQRPHSVVLLDEFEKANPAIWNLFLQVFDEGRLTDGWGQVANFSETVIILTSNLGVKEGNTRSAGFGSVEGFDSAKQDTSITDTLPPELLNRITETVRFKSLSIDAIREIASIELTQAFDRFAQSGWHIEFDEDVVTWIAASGYDARYGARHLQRNVERQVLPLLVAAPSRRLRLKVSDEVLCVEKVVN